MESPAAAAAASRLLACCSSCRCYCPKDSHTAHAALNSAGITTGYRIAGSTAQPSINSLYTPTNQTLNGSPVYANGDSSQFLYWNATGQWVIGDVLYSNQGMYCFCFTSGCGCTALVISVVAVMSCHSVILSACQPFSLSVSLSPSLSFPPSLPPSPRLTIEYFHL